MFLSLPAHLSLALPRSLKRLLLLHETAFLLLVIATGVLGAMWAYFWLQSSQQSVRLNAMFYEAQQIRGDLYTQLKEANRARLLEDDSALRRYIDYNQRIDRHFDNLQPLIADPQEQLVIDYMHVTYRTVRNDMDKIFASPYLLSEAVQMKVLDPLYEEWMLAEFESALLIFDEVIAKRRRQLEQTLARWARLAPWLVPIPIVLALMLLFWSRRSLQRGFVTPMANLTTGAEQISAGQLQHRIAPLGVSEVQDLAQAFNEMTQSLAESRTALVNAERQAALGALVPVVAHNIRNPLASIRATAQLVDESDDKAELLEARDAIIDTVDRLERWVSALLSYLHPLQPAAQNVSLAAIVEGALAPLQTKLTAKQLRVKLSDSEWRQELLVKADVDLLEQALYGLLNNAVDASPSAATIQLSLFTEKANSTVVLLIDDQGAGMPFQPEPRALSPGPSTKRFGTGLGIPFAFKVCEAHEGTLAFTSSPAGGTRVQLTLPLSVENSV